MNQESLDSKNPFEVPRVEKLVVNMGVNDAKEDIKALDVATAELAAIGGRNRSASGEEIDFEL